MALFIKKFLYIVIPNFGHSAPQTTSEPGGGGGNYA